MRRGYGLVCLLLIAITAAPGAAQPPPDWRTGAGLDINVDATGDATVILALIDAPADPDALVEGLCLALGQSPKEVTVNATTTNWFLSARFRGAVPRRGVVFAQTFDLNPLRDALRQQGRRLVGGNISHPRMDLGACPPALLYSRFGSSQVYYQFTIPDNDNPFEPFQLSFGYRSDRLFIYPVLALLGVAPLALALWLRRRAFRATEADPLAVWYGTWTWQQRLGTATCSVWILAVVLLDAGKITHFLLGHALAVGPAIVAVLLSLVPPLLVLLACHALLSPVLQRPAEVGWLARCFLKRRVWGYGGVVFVAFFAALGGEAVAAGQQRLAASFFAAGLLTGLAAFLGWGRTLIYPQKEVPAGELFTRAAELAEGTSVTLRRIVVWPAANWRLLNVFELPLAHLYLTEELAAHLSQRELDALLAHQLAFLWARRVRLQWVPIVYGLFVGAVGGYAAYLWLRSGFDPFRTFPLVVPALLVGWPLTELLLCRYSPRLDRAAVALTGDTEALLTALAKLDRHDLLPVTSADWRKQRPGDHNLRPRLEALAAAEDIPPERLDEILAGTGTGSDHYPPLPAASVAEATDQAFSPPVKRRIVRRFVCLLFAAKVLPLLLVGYLGEWAGVGGVVLGLGYALGAAAAWGLSRLVVRGTEWRVAHNVRQQLAARLLREGFRPTEAYGRLVGLAPEPHPRIYNGFFDWDLGTLGLYGDHLVYLGDQTRFRLRREQVTAVRLGPGPPRWWRTERVYLDWRDAERGTAGTLNLHYAREHSPLQVRLRRGPAELARWLQDWWNHGVPREDLPKELAALTTPPPDLAQGLSPRRAIGLSLLVVNLWMFALPTAGLAVIIGLPLTGAAWYPPIVLLGLLFLGHVPFWRYRDPA
jgi:hypothetical protein